MKRKKPDPELIDDENPEWTDEMFAEAEPAHIALPKIFGKKGAKDLMEGRITMVPLGRPRKARPKISTTLRLDSEILSRFRRGGRGWQSRINKALHDWLNSHPE